ncbi:putative proline utilization protein PrnX-like protein [Poronia punctata]|nr:putative proline utilization protein PrnX-like protein [Poronia punctata]
MSLAVLSAEVVRDLLENLTRDEVEVFADTLKQALHQYSTGTQAIDKSVFNQPARTAVRSEFAGTSTLFTPAISSLGHSIKVITVPSPNRDESLPPVKPTGSLTLYSPDGSPVGFLHAQTLTAYRTALASSCLLLKRSTVRTVTVFGAGIQAYWHIRLALLLRGDTIRTVNIINREFSDNAKEILRRFYQVPRETKVREGWEQAEFSMLTPGYGEYSRLQRDHIRDADVIYCCTPSTEELFDPTILTSHEGRRKGRLIVAVGSYTKDMRELPRDLLLQATKPHKGGRMHYHKHATEGGVIVVDTLDGALAESGEIIDAGLEPKQLVELGELVMINRMVGEETDSVNSRSSTDVDSVADSADRQDFSSTSSAMSTLYGSTDSQPDSRRSLSKSPARERRGSGGHSGNGGLFSSLRVKKHKRALSHPSPSADKGARDAQKRDDHLSRWLSSGNVIYKSVGLGLMDLVVGLEVLKLAQAKGKGTIVDNFSA